MLPHTPTSTLFPYTTLFRSVNPDPSMRLRNPFRRSSPVPGPSLRRAVFARCKGRADRKSTRLNSSHVSISYAVFCLKKKKIEPDTLKRQRTAGDYHARVQHH